MGNLFISELHSDPLYFWAVCFTVVFSICLHELSHGIVAVWLGDRTPIETGHMTLNPLQHMGFMSLILLLVAGIAWGAMPVDPRRLRGRYGPALVAAAGPACNIILAALALAALGLWQRLQNGDDLTQGAQNIRYLLGVFGITNIALAIFNLLPVPPLDGSRVLANFSPAYANMMMAMRKGGQSGLVFLIIFMFAGNIIFPASGTVARVFLQFVRGY